jgi:ubiquinone/menaquinone biosynthesis C-methylase UbiE
MSKKHNQAIQRQFAKTVDAFSKYAVRDAPEVLAEKVTFARPQPADLSLDVACGPGELVLALAPHVRFARGIDLTEEMLGQARRFQAERHIANAAFDRGEAERLPYPDAVFDLVTCQCSMHHLLKPEAALAEMSRVMKSQARLVIIDSVAPETEEKFELHNRIEKLRDASHTVTLRLTTLLSIFEKCNLEVARQTVKRRTRSFDSWMLRAGIKPGQKRYREVRRLMEESALGDRGGFSPQAQGDDIAIVHNEALFLLARAGVKSD